MNMTTMTASLLFRQMRGSRKVIVNIAVALSVIAGYVKAVSIAVKTVTVVIVTRLGIATVVKIALITKRINATNAEIVLKNAVIATTDVLTVAKRVTTSAKVAGKNAQSAQRMKSAQIAVITVKIVDLTGAKPVS